MKKVLAILISLLLLSSGLKVSIDKHYCDGSLAGIRLSLSGKLATCGMEDDEHSCPLGTALEKRCCEDHLSFYGFGSRYLPEFSTYSVLLTGKDISATSPDVVPQASKDLIGTIAWGFPPGEALHAENILARICVFRI